ncbi:MAG: hypothetical protein ACK4K3_07555 [Aquabacterium sp.]
MNPDQMNMVSAHHTLQTAYAAVSAAQDAPPGEQVMSFGVLFLQVCEVLRLDPSEMLDKAARVVRHARDHHSLELRALQNYIREELK